MLNMNDQIVVMKFGGTSVGSAERMDQVANIVKLVSIFEYILVDQFDSDF